MNPVASTGDTTLVDGNNATSTALDAARFLVVLPRLDALEGRHLVLSGVTNRTYRVEHNSRLGTTSGWTPLTNITFPANNSVAILSNALATNSPPAVATNRFFRAVRIP